MTGSDGKNFCRVHVIRETLTGRRSYDTLDFGTSSADDTPPYTVPEGRIFVMGDNRDNSADSRVSLAQNGLGGAIPIENIGGRAEFLTYSLSGNGSWNPLSWASEFRAERAGKSLRLVFADNRQGMKEATIRPFYAFADAGLSAVSVAGE